MKTVQVRVIDEFRLGVRRFAPALAGLFKSLPKRRVSLYSLDPPDGGYNLLESEIEKAVVDEGEHPASEARPR
ncbi:MAG TPA: hypothetical protein VIS96_09340 [Terrimicrobiaceae bacterium]